MPGRPIRSWAMNVPPDDRRFTTWAVQIERLRVSAGVSVASLCSTVDVAHSTYLMACLEWPEAGVPPLPPPFDVALRLARAAGANPAEALRLAGLALRGRGRLEILGIAHSLDVVPPKDWGEQWTIRLSLPGEPSDREVADG